MGLRDGEDPDYRFSFANERTFLAWLRTSLALLAAGVAIDTIDLQISADAQLALALTFVILGLLSGVAAWARWARAERSMRRKEALPAPSVSAVLVVGVVLASVVLLVAML